MSFHLPESELNSKSHVRRKDEKTAKIGEKSQNHDTWLDLTLCYGLPSARSQHSCSWTLFYWLFYCIQLNSFRSESVIGEKRRKSAKNVNFLIFSFLSYSGGSKRTSKSLKLTVMLCIYHLSTILVLSAQFNPVWVSYGRKNAQKPLISGKSQHWLLVKSRNQRQSVWNLLLGIRPLPRTL